MVVVCQPSARRSGALHPLNLSIQTATNLIFSLAQLLLGVLKGARGKWGDLATQRAMRTIMSARRIPASFPPMIKENEHGRQRVVVREALSESLEGVHLEVVRVGVVE